MPYYGIRFNQCPSRNVEQKAGGNGWKTFETFLRMMWVGCWGVEVGLSVGWGTVW